MEENIPEWTPPCDSMPWYITAFQSSPVRICAEKFEREEGVTLREDRAETVRGAVPLDATQDRSPEGNGSARRCGRLRDSSLPACMVSPQTGCTFLLWAKEERGTSELLLGEDGCTSSCSVTCLLHTSATSLPAEAVEATFQCFPPSTTPDPSLLSHAEMPGFSTAQAPSKTLPPKPSALSGISTSFNSFHSLHTGRVCSVITLTHTLYIHFLVTHITGQAPANPFHYSLTPRCCRQPCCS